MTDLPTDQRDQQDHHTDHTEITEKDPRIVKGRIFELDCRAILENVFDEVHELKQDKYGGLQPDFLCRKKNQWYLVEAKDISPTIRIKTAHGTKLVKELPEDFKQVFDEELRGKPLTPAELKEAFDAGKANWCFWTQDFDWMWTNLFQKKWRATDFMTKEGRVIDIKTPATTILITKRPLFYGFGTIDKKQCDDFLRKYIDHQVTFGVEGQPVEKWLRKIIK